MKTDATHDRASNRLGQQYVQWATGDGAKTEFYLSKTIGRADALLVFVNGAIKRPDEPSAAHDYKLRGFTNGYAGEKNAVKFAAAPGAGQAIAFIMVST